MIDWKRFLPPGLLFVVILLLAPGAGWLRDLLFERSTDSAVKILGLATVVAGIGVFLYAALRIRGGRRLRWAGLLGVCALLWLQTGFETGQTRVDVVEKIHVFEYGLLAYLLYRAMRPTGDLALLLLPMAGITVAGTLDEWVQWLLPRRFGEIRDVALNVVAGACGVLFALSVHPPESWTWRLTGGRGRRLGRTAAFAVLVMGLFVYCAHLGYEIEDPEIGRFRSRFTVQELRRLSSERAREWAVNPPSGLAVFGIEDYFLTEAAWHVNHRNASLKWGDFYLAWQANRILEKYYEPFLDLPSFRGSGVHRYAPKVRRRIKRKARPEDHDPKAYVSHVAIRRIFIRPSKPTFTTILAVVVVGLWTVSSVPGWRRRRT